MNSSGSAYYLQRTDLILLAGESARAVALANLYTVKSTVRGKGMAGYQVGTLAGWQANDEGLESGNLT